MHRGSVFNVVSLIDACTAGTILTAQFITYRVRISIQSDGASSAYSGFAPLYADGSVAEAACWAHARRKFYDLYVVDRSPLATEALQRIGALYAVEREIRGNLPTLRARVRQERAGPLLAVSNGMDAPIRPRHRCARVEV